MMRSVVKAGRGLGRPGIFLVVPVVILILCFCWILIHVMAQARSETLQRAGQTATSLIAAISSDISRNIETIDLSLQAVVDNLNRPGLDDIDPELRRLVLFNRAATARHLGAILVIDELGDLRIDSRTHNPQALNFADRDYFQVHKNADDVGTYIGRPHRTRVSGEWFIGISRRLSHPDGSFAGVVVATLRLSFFRTLFKDIALGRNGNVTLVRTDGTLIMGSPYEEFYPGLDLTGSAFHAHLAHSRSGIFEADSATDGVHRLVAYGQIGDLPLVVGVGQSTRHIFANWQRSMRFVVVLVSVLCVVTMLLSIYLTSEFTRRETAENELSTLTMSDGLTGLFNRRFFDEIIDREWRRCKRARLSPAVLMIDVDLLRPYNDKNGQRAGDALLKALGRAIAGTLRRPSDFAARYGGDEFAILLSGASVLQAENVSRLVRQRFGEECRKAGIPVGGLSIGIAVAGPTIGQSPDRLIEAAAQAVHLAKERGRGRTEVVSAPHELSRAA